MKFLLTHKGWFGVCPVHMQDPMRNPAPMVVERHWLLAPLFLFSELMFDLVYWMNPVAEPGWPLKITGKLDKPRVIDVPTE